MSKFRGASALDLVGFVPDVSTHFLLCVVGGPRFRAPGVDFGPRGRAFEGVLDPQQK